MISKLILMTACCISSIHSMEPTEKIEYMRNGLKYAQQLGFMENPEAKYEFMRKGGNFKEAILKQKMAKINVTVNQLPSLKESPVPSPKQPAIPSAKKPIAVNNPDSSTINLQSQIDDMQNKIKNLNEIVTTYQKKELEALKSQYEAMNQQYEEGNKNLERLEKLYPFTKNESIYPEKNSFEIVDEEENQIINAEEEMNEMLTHAMQEESNLEKILKDSCKLSSASSPPLSRRVKLDIKEKDKRLRRSTHNAITLHPVSLHFGTGNIIVNNQYKKREKN